jgi:Lipocalin-like domain
MRFAAAAALGLFAAPLAAHSAESEKNPLVGTWQLEQYVDTPESGTPVYAFGNPPVGLFVFTADGHVSISLMRNPPAVGTDSSDPDQDACIPAWYCSYFGTYRYDPAGPSWTTHVAGANIPNYLGTDQRRTFMIKGDLLTISETYAADGKTFNAKRVLRRVIR